MGMDEVYNSIDHTIGCLETFKQLLKADLKEETVAMIEFNMHYLNTIVQRELISLMNSLEDVEQRLK